jgi:hypothetical protein
VSNPSTPIQALAKIPFKNVHTQEVPPFGVIELAGSVVEDGITFLNGTRPSTNLRTEYAINGPSRVAPGDKAVCYRQGDLAVAYDSGTPVAGQGWGPRADQWTLAKGYPAIVTVHGVRNAGNKILHGALAPLSSVMGTATAETAAIANAQPGTQTFSLHVWDGTNFTAATPATTFIGYNISTEPIAANALTSFVIVHGLWIAAVSGQSLHELVKTTTTHSSGGTATVNIWTGAGGSEAVTSPLKTLSATNRTSVSIPSGKFCLATRIHGHWYIEPWEC